MVVKRIMNDKTEVSIIVTIWNNDYALDRCLNSILNSHYLNYELIVIDSASSAQTKQLMMTKFPKVLFYQAGFDILPSIGRNIGVSMSNGKFLLFIDGDNVIDKDMIDELLIAAREHDEGGVFGPKMCYLEKPSEIWCSGAIIDLFTSHTTFFRKENIDNSLLYKKGHFPNVYLVPRAIFKEIGGFDQINYPIHYEESDLAERIRRKGYGVYYVPKAVTFHDTPYVIKKTNGKYLGMENKIRTYYTARNRIIFMHNYGKNFFIFMIFFYSAFFFGYLFLLIKNKRFDLVKTYLIGSRDGFKRVIK